MNEIKSKKINCISVSLDDFTIASGSDDCTIRIWDTLSRQCIKIINNCGKYYLLLKKELFKRISIN